MIKFKTLSTAKLFLILQLFAVTIFAQSPSLINYQGAARLADGTPLDNRTISIKFDIHQGSSTGSIVATETQTVQTNLLGLFTTQIGKGVNLAPINWQANSMFLQVSMDTSSGSNFTNLGTQQMVSVPYALHASSVPSSYTNNILTIGSDTYALSPTVAVTPNTTLTVSGLGTVTSVGTNSFDINIPAPTFTNTGQTIISGSYPNYTVNTPTVPAAAVPTIVITNTAASTSSVASSGNSFSINVPPPTFTNAGPATITGAYPNFTINSSAGTTYTNGAGISLTSGSVIANTSPNITPTVAVTTTAAAGASVSSVGSSFSINVPAPTFTNAGPATITGAYPNFTINSSTGVTYTNGAGISITSGTIVNTLPHITPSLALTATAAAGPSVTSSGNSFSLNVPPPTFTNAGPATITGAYPNFTINSSTVTTYTNGAGIGLTSGSIITNAAPDQTVVLTNGGNVNITGTYPSFTLATPTAPSYTNGAGIGLTSGSIITNAAPDQTVTFNNTGQTLITGTYPTFSIATPTVAAPPTVAAAATGIATVSTGPNYTVGVQTPTFTNVSQNIITGSYPNFSVNTPTVIAPPTVAAAATGIATVSTGPNYTVGVQTPTFTNAGQNIITGSYPNFSVNTPTIANTSIALSATAAAGPSVGVVGTNSFNINIPPASNDWSILGNAGTSTVTNFIGTTDNVALNFRIFNQKSGTIDPILFNSYFGYLSGTANTTGNNNVGHGYLTLNSNTTGNSNVALGSRALSANTNGNANVAIGPDALLLNVGGIFNTAAGLNAARGNTSGNNNTAYGRDALYNNSTGSNNVALGYQAGFSETGSNKLYISNSSTSLTPLIYGDFSTNSVGIGTTSPVGNFHVVSTGASAISRISSTGATTGLFQSIDATGAILMNAQNTPLNLGTNNTNRIIITAAGNVGIGSGLAPVAPLLVRGSSSNLGIFKLYNANASGGDQTFIGFNVANDGADANDIARIGSIRSAGGGQGRLFFATGTLGTMVERMRIDEFGNVGIGTSTSAHMLTIDNQSVTTRDALMILNGRDQVGSGMPVYFQATTAGQTFGTNTYGRILRLENTTLGFADIGIDQASSFFISKSNNYNPNADFVITTAGNIGIGNSSPHAPLQFDNSIVSRKIVLWEGANNDHQFYGFGINNSILRYQVDITSADHVFYAGTSPTTSNELMRIKGNGNVVIGSSTATHKFQVFPSAIITNTEGQSNFFQNGNQGAAIYAESNDPGPIVYAQSFIAGWHPNSPFASNVGVWGNATGQGVNGYGMIATHGPLGAPTTYVGLAGPSFAGVFSGNVSITGSIAKSSGTFRIDHPQDPANKYLYHSFVESPDMMNVYNGNIVTDANGDAFVQLPSYFETLNIDFRYQLTVMGQFAQAIVAEEVISNQFKIKTDKPNVKVSWQVTGVRNDEYARANRVVPEVEKKGTEKGKYLHPDLFGFGKEMQIVPDKPEGNIGNQGQQK